MRSRCCNAPVRPEFRREFVHGEKFSTHHACTACGDSCITWHGGFVEDEVNTGPVGFGQPDDGCFE